MIEYQRSVNQKHLIMRGVFHNMECGVIIEKVNPTLKVGEIDGCHMLANPFLFAVVFELAIKSMWELSHSEVFAETQIHQYGHSIDRIYPYLSQNFRHFIEKEYNREVQFFRNELQAISNSEEGQRNHTKDQWESIFNCPYLTLEECLKQNLDIIIHGKYKFQEGSKINVVTGIIPYTLSDNDLVDTYGQPSSFLKRIIDYIGMQLHLPDCVKNLP